MQAAGQVDLAAPTATHGAEAVGRDNPPVANQRSTTLAERMDDNKEEPATPQELVFDKKNLQRSHFGQTPDAKHRPEDFIDLTGNVPLKLEVTDSGGGQRVELGKKLKELIKGKEMTDLDRALYDRVNDIMSIVEQWESGGTQGVLNEDIEALTLLARATLADYQTLKTRAEKIDELKKQKGYKRGDERIFQSGEEVVRALAFLEQTEIIAAHAHGYEITNGGNQTLSFDLDRQDFDVFVKQAADSKWTEFSKKFWGSDPKDRARQWVTMAAAGGATVLTPVLTTVVARLNEGDPRRAALEGLLIGASSGLVIEAVGNGIRIGRNWVLSLKEGTEPAENLRFDLQFEDNVTLGSRQSIADNPLAKIFLGQGQPNHPQAMDFLRQSHVTRHAIYQRLGLEVSTPKVRDLWSVDLSPENLTKGVGGVLGYRRQIREQIQIILREEYKDLLPQAVAGAPAGVDYLDMSNLPPKLRHEIMLKAYDRVTAKNLSVRSASVVERLVKGEERKGVREKQTTDLETRAAKFESGEIALHPKKDLKTVADVESELEKLRHQKERLEQGKAGYTEILQQIRDAEKTLETKKIELERIRKEKGKETDAVAGTLAEGEILTVEQTRKAEKDAAEKKRDQAIAEATVIRDAALTKSDSQQNRLVPRVTELKFERDGDTAHPEKGPGLQVEVWDLTVRYSTAKMEADNATVFYQEQDKRYKILKKLLKRTDLKPTDRGQIEAEVNQLDTDFPQIKTEAETKNRVALELETQLNGKKQRLKEITDEITKAEKIGGDLENVDEARRTAQVIFEEARTAAYNAFITESQAADTKYFGIVKDARKTIIEAEAALAQAQETFISLQKRRDDLLQSTFGLTIQSGVPYPTEAGLADQISHLQIQITKEEAELPASREKAVQEKIIEASESDKEIAKGMREVARVSKEGEFNRAVGDIYTGKVDLHTLTQRDEGYTNLLRHVFGDVVLQPEATVFYERLLTRSAIVEEAITFFNVSDEKASHFFANDQEGLALYHAYRVNAESLTQLRQDISRVRTDKPAHWEDNLKKMQERFTQLQDSNTRTLNQLFEGRTSRLLGEHRVDTAQFVGRLIDRMRENALRDNPFADTARGIEVTPIFKGPEGTVEIKGPEKTSAGEEINKGGFDFRSPENHQINSQPVAVDVKVTVNARGQIDAQIDVEPKSVEALYEVLPANGNQLTPEQYQLLARLGLSLDVFYETTGNKRGSFQELVTTLYPSVPPPDMNDMTDPDVAKLKNFFGAFGLNETATLARIYGPTGTRDNTAATLVLQEVTPAIQNERLRMTQYGLVNTVELDDWLTALPLRSGITAGNFYTAIGKAIAQNSIASNRELLGSAFNRLAFPSGVFVQHENGTIMMYYKNTQGLTEAAAVNELMNLSDGDLQRRSAQLNEAEIKRILENIGDFGLRAIQSK